MDIKGKEKKLDEINTWYGGQMLYACTSLQLGISKLDAFLLSSSATIIVYAITWTQIK